MSETIQLSLPVTNQYLLPHADLRPGQLDSILWCEKVKKVGIIQAPTGSGKTSFAAANGATNKTLALVATKSLQQTNYGDSYSFDVLFGKSNYDCVHPNAPMYATADECLYAKDMTECEVSRHCEYFIRRNKAKLSDKASLNYAYWLSSYWPRKNDYHTLFLDEAHLLSDVTLNWVGCTVGADMCIEWSLPSLPYITRSIPAKADLRTRLVQDWLREAIAMLPDPRNSPVRDGKLDKRYKRGQRLAAKLSATQGALFASSEAWFIRSTPGQSIVIRPLTARHHFPNLFTEGDWRTILMSATIGDVSTYATELGISEYEFRDVPNLWPVAVRPVRVLDAPKMSSKKSTPADYQHQAEVIRNAIGECPPSWGGVIHVTRKTEAQLLKRRLEDLGVRRLWTPDPTHSTNEQMQSFKAFKVRNPGAIAIAWAWWEGVDLTEERICIVAKSPFPYLGDEYEQERMVFDDKMFLQRTAWQMEQGLGRTRRGDASDYDMDGKREQLVAIADGNWTRCKSYLSTSLVESIG